MLQEAAGGHFGFPSLKKRALSTGNGELTDQLQFPPLQDMWPFRHLFIQSIKKQALLEILLCSYSFHILLVLFDIIKFIFRIFF